MKSADIHSHIMGSDHCPVELVILINRRGRDYMKDKFKIAFKLVFGLFLFALGVVFTINAGIGVAPWDVFHQGGVAKVTGITVG